MPSNILLAIINSIIALIIISFIIFSLAVLGPFFIFVYLALLIAIFIFISYKEDKTIPYIAPILKKQYFSTKFLIDATTKEIEREKESQAIYELKNILLKTYLKTVRFLIILFRSARDSYEIIYQGEKRIGKLFQSHKKEKEKATTVSIVSLSTLIIAISFASAISVFFPKHIEKIYATPVSGAIADFDAVYWYDGEAYTDQTAQAAETTVDDVNITSDTAGYSSIFGSNYQFSKVKFEITTPSSGDGDWSASYFSSTTNSWTPLTATDNTANFTASGTIEYIIPSDWRKSPHNDVSVESNFLTASSTASGYLHSLAVKSDGTVWEWGSTNGTNVPTQVPGLTNVVSASGGEEYSLALKSDNTVWAWGYGVDGQLGDGTNISKNTPVQVQGLTDVVFHSAGFKHSLAVKSDGTAWAWGLNSSGQLGNGTSINTNIPVQVSDLTGVVSVSGGGNHSLALKSDGTVWAWGLNSHGQLGDGTTAGTSTPVQVSGLTDVIAVSAGWWHSLALKSDGTVWAWGQGDWGKLGNGASIDSYTPVQVSGLSGIVSISAGSEHSLAVKSDGTIWAWGSNSNGQLGDGTNTSYSIPVQTQGISTASSVSASGQSSSIAMLSDNIVWAWGWGNSGQLGNGVIGNSNTPIRTRFAVEYYYIKITTDTPYTVPALASQASVVGYEVKLKVIKEEDGSVFSGLGSGNFIISGCSNTSIYNFSEESAGIYRFSLYSTDSCDIYVTYGNGYVDSDALSTGILSGVITDKTSEPLILKPGLKVVLKDELGNDIAINNITEVSAGDDHSLALKSDGTVWAWGHNYYGELGDGTNNDSAVPIQVPGLYNVISIAGEDHHSLALKSDGTVWAWGENFYGQLGDGTNNDSNIPVQVSGLSDITSIARGAAGDHSLALKSDGTVWAWGANNNGQLGDGTNIHSNIPIQISGLADVTSIAGGHSHSLVLKSDGTVWAWGYNGRGELGDGTNDDSSIPVQVSGLTGVIAIAANEHSLALKSDGTVWAWGYNNHGQLGDDGANENSNIPLQVIDSGDPTGYLTGVTAIAAGDYHSLALKSDNTVWAWGYNSHGQLGDDNINADYSYPVQTVISEVASVAGGSLHSLALKSDGTVWAWGRNFSGELGDDNAPTGSSIAVKTIENYKDMFFASASHDASSSNIYFWKNTTAENNGLTVQKDGYVSAITTHSGLSDITTLSSPAQIILNFGDYSAVSDPITASVNLKGLQFSNKVILKDSSDNAISGATVVVGDSYSIACSEKGITGEYYCAVPISHTSLNIRATKTGYDTATGSFSTDRTDNTDAQVVANLTISLTPAPVVATPPPAAIPIAFLNPPATPPAPEVVPTPDPIPSAEQSQSPETTPTPETIPAVEEIPTPTLVEEVIVEVPATEPEPIPEPEPVTETLVVEEPTSVETPAVEDIVVPVNEPAPSETTVTSGYDFIPPVVTDTVTQVAGAVANSVTQTVEAMADIIAQPIVVVNNQIAEVRQIKQVVTATEEMVAPVTEAVAVAAGAVTVTVIATSAMGAQAASAIAQASVQISEFLKLSALLSGLGIRRRRPWGRVYNFYTGQAIANAQVFLIRKQFNKLVDTQTTDKEGRFSFLISSDSSKKTEEYYIKAAHDNYTFKLDGELAPNTYHGQTIKTEDILKGSLNLDIPLEPNQKEIVDNSKTTVKSALIKGINAVQFFFNAINSYILIIGIALSLTVTAIVPSYTNKVVLIIYLIMGILKAYFSMVTGKSYGQTKDKFDHHPLDLTAVRVFDAKKNILLTSRVTGQTGKFNFLLPAGFYYLTATRAGYKPFKSEIVDFKKSSIVSFDVDMEKE